MAVLAVVLRADFGPGRPGTRVVCGVREVAEMARPEPGSIVQPALVNDAAGAVVTVSGRPFAVMGFTVAHGRILE